ncbi:META domain-containing protein [Nocardioides alpinus]|uniref:META domain-containing protein n=1 Tax=Nocardioides alpinus TaxID=748909 RepID=A0A1I0XC01_9ACTN|nr:META domain-containing protein [Nocardioides alpinus]PKH44260.1 META domain-containing protein [Nocardioides alpinus]SFA98555.1 META domain-containing protein [Nocardioides alpinus]
MHTTTESRRHRSPADRVGWTVRLAAGLLLAGLLTACGGDSDDGEGATSSPSTSPTSSTSSAEVAAADLDAAALDATSYASTSVEGHDLVPGSSVEVTFDGDTMSAYAGCNTLFGPFEVDGSMLAWSGPPAATMMMCEPELMDQDQWLSDLLTTGVTATQADGALTWEADGVVIELASAPSEDLDSLLGATWTVLGTVSDGAVSRLPVDTRRPRLDVAADGLSRVFTGCRSGRTTVRVDGASLAFANTSVQQGRCTGAAGKTEREVLALLDGTADNVELHDSLLVVTKGGRGLFFQVR